MTDIIRYTPLPHLSRIAQYSYTKINEEYLAKFNRLVSHILPQKDRKRTGKVVDYIRLYTNLISASHLSIEKNTHEKGIQLLRDVIRYTKRNIPNEEKFYMLKIRKITMNVLSAAVRKKADIFLKNPAHANTKLQVAQNICVLRILKLIT